MSENVARRRKNRMPGSQRAPIRRRKVAGPGASDVSKLYKFRSYNGSISKTCVNRYAVRV